MNRKMLYWHEHWNTAILFDGNVHRISRVQFGKIASIAKQGDFASLLRDAATADTATIRAADGGEETDFRSMTTLLAHDQSMFGGGAPQAGFGTESARLFSKGVGRQLRHPGQTVCIRKGSTRTHFEPELGMLLLPADGLPGAVTLSIDVGAEDVEKDMFGPEGKAYSGAMAALPVFAVWNEDGSCPLDGNAVIRMSFERPSFGGLPHQTEMRVANYLALVPSLQDISGTGKRLLTMSDHEEGVFLTPGKAGVGRTDDNGIQVGDFIIVTVDGLPELRMKIGMAA